MAVNLNPAERKTLRVLDRYYDGYGGFGFISFATISHRSRLSRREVRRACRSLTRKGLAEYSRGLFNEDGEVAGAGYGCTKAGRDALGML